MRLTDRRARVDRDDPVLAIVTQCRLLKIARSTLYYRPAPVDPDDLAVMRRMDELYLASPFYGSRRMVAVLRRSWPTIMATNYNLSLATIYFRNKLGCMPF
jgi:putative transposase